MTDPQPDLREASASPLLCDRVLSLADRYRHWLMAAAVGLLALGFNGQWRPEPDAALYLTIGRSIAEGEGYRYHGSTHPLAYPGLPWAWAGVFGVSPEHAIPVAHALMLAASVGCLALTYRLILLHAGRPIAVIVMFGLAMTRMFFRYTFELRSDIPFLLGVLGVLIGFESLMYADRSTRSKRLWLDVPMLVGGLMLAVVMRPTMWALLAAIATTLVIGIARGRLKAGGLMLLGLAGVAAVVMSLDPRPGSQGLGDYEQGVWSSVQHASTLAGHVVTRNLPSLVSPAAAEALFGIDFGGQSTIPGISVNTIPSLVVLGLGLLLFRFRLLWGALFAWTIVMVLAVLALDRYLLPVLPLLIYAWWWVAIRLNRKLPGPWGNVAFAAMVVFGAATNLPRVAAMAIEQRSPNLLERYRGGKYAFAPGVASEIRQHTPEPVDSANGPWVVGPQRFGRILTYYSRRWVIEAGKPSQGYGQPADRLFVLNPTDPDVRAFLESRNATPSAPISGTPPWTLHSLIPLQPR